MTKRQNFKLCQKISINSFVKLLLSIPMMLFIALCLPLLLHLFPHRLADALLSGKRLRDRDGANS